MNKTVKPTELPLEPIALEEADAFLQKGRVTEIRGSVLTIEDKGNTFDWNTDEDCIILHEQPATAVYHGKGGHIVIRQTNGHDEDVTILIAPENATAFQEGLAAYLRK